MTKKIEPFRYLHFKNTKGGEGHQPQLESNTSLNLSYSIRVSVLELDLTIMFY